MSISDRQMLIKEFESKLNNVLTVSQKSEVMKLLAEQLVEYDVSSSGDKNQSESINLIRIFLEAKRIEGRSDKTIARYDYILNRIFKDINVPIKSINVYHLRTYLMNMKDNGKADSTIEGYREILCAFYSWLQKEGLIQNNPCSNLNPIKCAKVLRLPYSDVEIELIKESCGSVRNKAIICFLLSTGCRISEMCELNRNDIDLNSLECIVHGKGDKERTVYLSNVAVMNLRKYLGSRTDSSPALFIGKGSERMTPGGIRFMLKKVENKSGVVNVHPHRFRRTLATNLINRGMSIQEVASILGHDKIDTTMSYIYIDKKNVKTAYQKYA